MKTTTDTSKKLRSTLLAAAVAMACGSALAQQDPVTDTDSQTSQYPSDQPSLPTDPVPTEQQPNDPMNQMGNPNDPANDPVSPTDPLNQNMDQPQPPNDTMQSDPRPDSDLSQYETRENRNDDPMTDEPAAQQANDWSQQSAGQDGKALSEQLSGEDDLGEFVAALETAGLANALSSGTEYTVFAPTDDAFEKFKEEKGEGWSAEENVEELREVLRSHVVSGKLDRTQLEELDSAKVLTGSVVDIKSENDELRIGDAKVEGEPVTTAANLTIYKIDGVIDPNSLSQQDTSAGIQSTSGSSQAEESAYDTDSQYGSETESSTQSTTAGGVTSGSQSTDTDSQYGADSPYESQGESSAASGQGSASGSQSDTSQPYDETQQYDTEYEDELADEEEAEE